MFNQSKSINILTGSIMPAIIPSTAWDSVMTSFVDNTSSVVFFYYN